MGQLGVSTDKCPESRKLSEHINSIHGQSAEKSLILEKHLLVRVFKDRYASLKLNWLSKEPNYWTFNNIPSLCMSYIVI